MEFMIYKTNLMQIYAFAAGGTNVYGGSYRGCQSVRGISETVRIDGE